MPLAENWPSTGEIKFDGCVIIPTSLLCKLTCVRYATKYRPELPCVLENFNLDVLDNEKVNTLVKEKLGEFLQVGIVGRTGAGKSSLSLALFRMIEPTKGTISIAGRCYQGRKHFKHKYLSSNRDITTIGLQDLRARLTIIPQVETVL